MHTTGRASANEQQSSAFSTFGWPRPEERRCGVRLSWLTRHRTRHRTRLSQGSSSGLPTVLPCYRLFLYWTCPLLQVKQQPVELQSWRCAEFGAISPFEAQFTSQPLRGSWARVMFAFQLLRVKLADSESENPRLDQTRIQVDKRRASQRHLGVASVPSHLICAPVPLELKPGP
jgi:hypothetical protein